MDLPHETELKTTTTPDSAGYLTGHLRSIRENGAYQRQSYGQKAWRTFGSSVPDDRTTTIIDIGAGECELVEVVKREQGYLDVSVIDMSAEVVAVATELGLTATLVEDSEAFLVDRPASYDVVFLLHVLEHVQKDAIIPLLRAIRASLREGGRLLLEVPNMGDPLNGLHVRYADFTHEVGFTEESLTYVLDQAGFSNVDFLENAGAQGRITRPLQILSQKLLRGFLFVINLPNGRQMRRRIGPALSVRADR